MSIISELNFFLGLQVNQNDKGIFISKYNYVKEILKKFGMDDSKLVSTPMVTRCKLSKSDESTKTNQSKYKSMIGGLLYLIATRLNIMHAIYLVAIFQEDPKEAHVTNIKRISSIYTTTIKIFLPYTLK